MGNAHNQDAEYKYDIVIHNAIIRTQPGEYVDIGISKGLIVEISPKIKHSAKIDLDANGGLVSESFVNPHLHLCKVYTLDLIEEKTYENYHSANMEFAMTAIEQAAKVKEHCREESIIKNVRKAINEAIYYGCTHVRAFADVDSKAQLKGINALIKVREEFKNLVEIQVVAFAQDGIIREPGTQELLHQAMVLGSDVIGGIPWIEYTEEDIHKHIQLIFMLAQEFNCDVSMLVDDAGDSNLRSLEGIAVETIRVGWTGRTLAHHARAMALYSPTYLHKVIALMKKAQVSLVSNPHTGPLHAPVHELIREGVNVCLSQDDISDAYYPYGRNNMLEVAFLASHLLWFTRRADIQVLFEMITRKAAQAIGIQNHEIKIGSKANLVVLNQSNVLEALRYHEAPRYVISHGNLVDSKKYKP
jgi:cytosine/creatinine deaminase